MNLMSKGVPILFLFLLLSIMPIANSYKFCLDNQTLREVAIEYINGSKKEIYYDYQCKDYCKNSTIPSCQSYSIPAVLLVISLPLSIFLAFNKSPIVSILGSLLMLMIGIWLLFGIDLNQIFYISNITTLLLGLVLIGLSLIRVSFLFF